MDQHASFRAYYRPVCDVLLKSWDPIGIADCQGAEDEYDSYAPQVIRLLIQGALDHEILEWLRNLELHILGREAAPEVRLEAARLLTEIRENAEGAKAS